MKILIVDDETNILEIVEAYLITHNYQVFRAMDGEEALRKAETIVPDLIVLDLMLPDISGLEVCQKIREFSNVPIIMLTAKTAEQDILKGLQLGADDYVKERQESELKEYTSELEALYREDGTWEENSQAIQSLGRNALLESMCNPVFRSIMAAKKWAW